MGVGGGRGVEGGGVSVGETEPDLEGSGERVGGFVGVSPPLPVPLSDPVTLGVEEREGVREADAH